MPHDSIKAEFRYRAPFRVFLRSAYFGLVLASVGAVMLPIAFLLNETVVGVALLVCAGGLLAAAGWPFLRWLDGGTHRIEASVHEVILRTRTRMRSFSWASIERIELAGSPEELLLWAMFPILPEIRVVSRGQIHRLTLYSVSTRDGFDLELLRSVCARHGVPLVEV